jgi:hypothetical protein
LRTNLEADEAVQNKPSGRSFLLFTTMDSPLRLTSAELPSVLAKPSVI